jgi:integrase
MADAAAFGVARLWRKARPPLWLFPSRMGAFDHISARQLSRGCRAAAASAEIRKRVTLHTLRHSFAMAKSVRSPAL